MKQLIVMMTISVSSWVLHVSKDTPLFRWAFASSYRRGGIFWWLTSGVSCVCFVISCQLLFIIFMCFVSKCHRQKNFKRAFKAKTWAQRLLGFLCTFKIRGRASGPFCVFSWTQVCTASSFLQIDPGDTHSCIFQHADCCIHLLSCFQKKRRLLTRTEIEAHLWIQVKIPHPSVWAGKHI